MAKLYWRVKVNGKWTWRPAKLNPSGKQGIWTLVQDYVEEEE